MTEPKPYTCPKCKAKVYVRPNLHAMLCHLYQAKAKKSVAVQPPGDRQVSVLP